MARPATSIAVAAGIALFLLRSGGTLVVQSTQSPLPRVLDAREPITYFIAEGVGSPGFRSGDRELAQWALDAWQKTAVPRLRFTAAREADALVRVYWAEANGGQYGEMRPLVLAGRRGAAVYIRPDVDALGEDIGRRARSDQLLRDTIVYLTCLHELGHALGMPHTSDFRDIMYSFGFGGDIVEYFDRYRRQLRSRDDILAVSGLSDADARRLRTMYVE
jgi:hypothetical protein